MSDAIVIGAGVGGLSAAICLAAAGTRVRVLESASEIGGKAGVAVVDGVEVDTGPSVLTMPAVFEQLLAKAGMRLEEEAPLVRADPFYRYLWPDGTRLDLPPDLEGTLRAVRGVLGAEAADDLDAFLGYAREIWEIALPRFITAEVPSLSTFLWLGAGGIREAAKLDAFSTMWSAIERRVRSQKLRDLLARYATYNGSDPRRAVGTLNCIAHVELTGGAASIRGGTYELVRALHRAASRLGVRFELGCEVGSIDFVRGRVSGVTTADGRPLSSGRVVANADAALVADVLAPRAAKRLGGALREPSTSGLCLVVRAARQADRAAHTVLFPRHYEDEFTDLFDRRRPPHEPTVYVCAQEKSNERAGWPDHEPLFVMVNAPAEPRDGRSDEARWVELERVAMGRLRAAGVVGAEDQVVWRRSPTDLARRFPGSRGAIYGAASHGWDAAFKRPANRVKGVEGLYLASGSAHPGGGLPLVALSGMTAAKSLVADLDAGSRGHATRMEGL